MKRRSDPRYERKDSGILRRKIELVRSWIFKKGTVLNGTAVDGQLKQESLVPTRVSLQVHIIHGLTLELQNAFSKLLDHGFNFFSMFVPDLLHEFELGVWKAIFTHLIRIMQKISNEVVSKLNERYRAIPPFGRTTIRRFHNNAAAMKKLAARDFEDLLQVFHSMSSKFTTDTSNLQCALPVFEGLLPEPHNTIVQDLLFTLAVWHALAKLRLHTSTTVSNLEGETNALGKIVRHFVKVTCVAFDTKELPGEKQQRARRKAMADAAKKGARPPVAAAAASQPSESESKILNLLTYKFHALGDYAKTILRFGTTDSYSTQIVSQLIPVLKNR